MALICKQCGAEVPDNADKCPACGAPIAAPSNGETVKAQIAEEKITPKKVAIRAIYVVIFGVFIVYLMAKFGSTVATAVTAVIILVGIIWYMYKTNGGTTKK